MTENKRNLFIKILLVSVLCGLILVFALLIFFAVLMQLIDIGDRTCIFISSISLFIGAFVSGFSGGFFVRKKGLITGCACGAMMFLCMLVLNLVMRSGYLFSSVIFKFILCLISGGVGGCIGVNKRIHKGLLSSLKGIISM